MCPARPTLLTLLLASLCPAARGDDPAAEAILKGKGLARSGSTFVIEAEVPVLEKMKEARAAFAAYAAPAEKQAKAQAAPATIEGLEGQRAETQAALDDLNAKIAYWDGLRSGNDRSRNLRLSRAMTPDRIDMNARRDQLRGAIAENGRQQKDARALILPDEKAKALDAEVREKAEALKAGLVALRPLVDDVNKQYAGLAADESVKKALADAKRATKVRLKLGPSDAFAAGARELDQAERNLLGKKPAPSRAKAKPKK